MEARTMPDFNVILLFALRYAHKNKKLIGEARFAGIIDELDRYGIIDVCCDIVGHQHDGFLTATDLNVLCEHSFSGYFNTLIDGLLDLVSSRYRENGVSETSKYYCNIFPLIQNCGMAIIRARGELTPIAPMSVKKACEFHQAQLSAIPELY